MSGGSYRLIRSDRKTISIQITPGGEVVVRCPRRLSDRAVREFVESKKAWIEKHVSEASAEPDQPPLTQGETQALTRQAAEQLPRRAAFFAPLVGVDYGRITIRTQRSRWGSCSSRGNISFNCLLMLAPAEVRDYVVVHELCHRLEMNHSKAFWSQVERVMPDYRRPKAWLKAHGTALIRRLDDPAR